MHLTFPIDGVAITSTPSKSFSSLYEREHLRINEQELFMSVPDVADYYVRNGEEVAVLPAAEADEKSVQLFLSGSVLGAVLHQRGIIPFHGSSFSFNGKGVMVIGVSGAGKSSTTAAFCSKGAGFINDDINPVLVKESGIMLQRIRTNVKLWDDSLAYLGITNDSFSQIRPDIDKFYVPFDKGQLLEEQPLHHIVLLGTHNEERFAVEQPAGIEKYNILRRNIYRKMYLRGMPQTEKSYFQKLLKIANTVTISIVKRPDRISPLATMDFIKEHVLL